MNTARKATFYKLLSSAGAVVFSLVLLEMGLRLFRPINYRKPEVWSREFNLMHEASAIPGLTYDLAPNHESIFPPGVPVKTNSYGMRDRERTLQKPPGTVRIAAIGDSFAFGFGVSAEETFASVLEGMLNESSRDAGGRYEVLNFGVSGYCSRDEALVVKYKAVAWNPDVVVVAYVLNDPETDPIQPLHYYFDKTLWWQYSHLFRLIARANHNWEMRRLGGGDYFRYLHAEGQPKWQSVVRAFQDIREASSSRGIKVMVVIFPEVTDKSWASTWAKYPYPQIHKQVGDLAVKNGFGLLDLLGAYVGHVPRDLFRKGWDDHPNREGHRLAARAIYDKLLADRFLSGAAAK
jgi:lysophospholipase L1-like esterase